MDRSAVDRGGRLVRIVDDNASAEITRTGTPVDELLADHGELVGGQFRVDVLVVAHLRDCIDPVDLGPVQALDRLERPVDPKERQPEDEVEEPLLVARWSAGSCREERSGEDRCGDQERERSAVPEIAFELRHLVLWRTGRECSLPVLDVQPLQCLELVGVHVDSLETEGRPVDRFEKLGDRTVVQETVERLSELGVDARGHQHQVLLDAIKRRPEVPCGTEERR